jgi:uncharacterized protein
LVFRRRDRRPILRVIADLFYPRGGWKRSFRYVRHRVRRLPDTPERIARGIWAGVFTSFSPLFGLHFIIAAVIARAMRGNTLAALMATFFGNPVTFVFIALTSMKTGNFLLGTKFEEGSHLSIGGKFAGAFEDLKNNFIAMFIGSETDWHALGVFYKEVFLPYLVGGLIPGAVAATICFYISLPLIRAYKYRRRGAIKAKFEAIKKKAVAKADVKRNAD